MTFNHGTPREGECVKICGRIWLLSDARVKTLAQTRAWLTPSTTNGMFAQQICMLACRFCACFCMSMLSLWCNKPGRDDALPLKRHLICRPQLHTGRIKSRKTVSPKFWHAIKVQFSGRDGGAGNENTCVFGILSAKLQRKKKQKKLLSRILKLPLHR